MAGDNNDMAPFLEEWRQLYDAAAEFKETAPWDWMWDADMFAVQNPEDGEMGYCCALGRNKEVFGLAVYLGPEGLKGYLKVVSGEVTLDNPDALHTKKCLLASFEDRKYLSNDDLAVIKQLGLHFSGANSWPQFQSWQPGYLPWQLTKGEAVYLTLCLQQAKVVALRFKDSPDMLEPSQPGYYFTRIAKKEKNRLKWKDAWLKPVFLRKMVMVRQTIEEVRLERMRQLDRQQKMVWEVDFFYAPAYVAEKGRRPYYPLVFLWVEQYSYFIFSTHITTSDKYKIEFIEYCLRAFESAKIIPGEIQVRKEELLAYLQPLAQKLGFEVRLVKKLRAIDDARKSMKEFLGKPFSRTEPKIGRNDPCLCGSGKKYKKCCGQ